MHNIVTENDFKLIVFIVRLIFVVVTSCKTKFVYDTPIDNVINMRGYNNHRGLMVEVEKLK